MTSTPEPSERWSATRRSADARPAPHTRSLRILLVLVTPAALFYLFVFPALVATGTMEITWYSVLFAALLYLQLWMVVADSVLEVAAGAYGFRKPLLNPLERLMKRRGRVVHAPRALLIPSAFLSYGVTVYGFAIAYFVSQLDPAAFHPGPLGLFDACYFSVTTASTAGFGDVTPVPVPARALVMAEIAVTFCYVAFLVSVLPTLSRRDGPAPEHAALESR